MKNKIIVFGDSITFGAWDMECAGWVNRMRLAIDNDKSIISAHVFNMGISGQIVSEITGRIDDECGRRVLEEANNVVVLSAGINDTQLIPSDASSRELKLRTGREQFRNDVTELIRRAKRYTDKVIYMGLTPVDERLTNPIRWDRSKNWRNECIIEYDGIIREICASEGIDYVYVYDAIDPFENWDGLHPAAAGHKILAEIMGAAVRKYIV